MLIRIFPLDAKRYSFLRIKEATMLHTVNDDKHVGL